MDPQIYEVLRAVPTDKDLGELCKKFHPRILLDIAIAIDSHKIINFLSGFDLNTPCQSIFSRSLLEFTRIGLYGYGGQAISPLTVALLFKNYKIAKLFIDKGIDIDGKWQYLTLKPLAFACINNDQIAVQLLLESKADPNIDDGIILRTTYNEDIKKLLMLYNGKQIAEPVSCIVQKIRGVSPMKLTAIYNEDFLLYAACRSGDIQMLQYLVNQGSDLSRMIYIPAINYSNGLRESTAIKIAIQHGQLRALQILLNANVPQHRSIFKDAISSGHISIIRYLYNRLDTINASKITHILATSSKDVIDLLIELKIFKPNYITIGSLFAEACRCNIETMKRIYQFGPDLNFANGRPMINAIRDIGDEAVKLLIEMKADLKKGNDLLSIAIDYGRIETIKILFAAGHKYKKIYAETVDHLVSDQRLDVLLLLEQYGIYPSFQSFTPYQVLNCEMIDYLYKRSPGFINLTYNALRPFYSGENTKIALKLLNLGMDEKNCNQCVLLQFLNQKRIAFLMGTKYASIKRHFIESSLAEINVIRLIFQFM